MINLCLFGLSVDFFATDFIQRYALTRDIEVPRRNDVPVPA